MIEIETPRLLLRRFTLDDAAPMAAYRNNPEIARYQGWPSPLTAEAAVAQVRAYSNGDPDEPGWFQYAIELRASRALVGDLGVLLGDDRLHAVIGFTLAPAHHHRGYATEAVQAMVEHLFTRGLQKVSADCDARNTPSARVLERAGFQPAQQADASRPEYPQEPSSDESGTLMFALTASRWRQQHP